MYSPILDSSLLPGIGVNLIDKAFMRCMVLHELGLELTHLPAQLVTLLLELGRLHVRRLLCRLCFEGLYLALNLLQVPLLLLFGVLELYNGLSQLLDLGVGPFERLRCPIVIAVEARVLARNDLASLLGRLAQPFEIPAWGRSRQTIRSATLLSRLGLYKRGNLLSLPLQWSVLVLERIELLLGGVLVHLLLVVVVLCSRVLGVGERDLEDECAFLDLLLLPVPLDVGLHAAQAARLFLELVCILFELLARLRVVGGARLHSRVRVPSLSRAR